MSVVDWIRGLFAKAAFGMVPGWEQGQPQWTEHNYYNFAKEGYRKNEIMYACIRERATSVQEAPLVAYRRRNGEREDLPEKHPLVELLNRPNPHMTQADLVAIWSINLDIAGNAYVAKLRTNAGQIGELWHLRPDRVKVVPDAKRYVGAYDYEVSGLRKRLDANDVIHDKFYDPLNDYYGLSPIAAAARSGDVDNELLDFVKNFIEGGVQVPYWLVYKKGKLHKTEKDRIRRQYRELYGGYKKWIAPGVLDVDLDILRTGLDFQQMDFKFLRAMTEARICSIFGVPPQLVGAEVGLEHATYSNYEEAEKSFLNNRMKPLWKQIEDALNMGLASEFGDDVVIEFDLSQVQALQEDVGKLWERMTKAFAATAITREQFWAGVGLEEPTEGTFMQPMMLVPVEIGKGAPQQEEAAKAIQSILYRPAEDRSEKALTLYEEKANRFGSAVSMTARAWEGRFREAAQKLFAQEREDALKILKKEGKASKQGEAFQAFLIAMENYYNKAGEEWRRVFLPVFEALLTSQGDNLGAAFGIAFDVSRPEVAGFLNSYVMEFAEGIVGNSGKQVKDIILKGQLEGWSVPDMRNALMEEFGQFDRVRAERIARYETMNSSNAGALEAYRQAGVEEQQWWDGQEGACGWCRALHKKVISVREFFFRKGDAFDITDAEGNTQTMKITYTDIGHPPLHNHCRCTSVPVVKI